MSRSDWLGLAFQACIVLTVFGFGLSATWQEATFLFRHPTLLLRAVLSMSVVMPAIAAVVAAQSHLPSEVQVALVALAMSPVPPIIQTKQVGAGGRMDYVVGLLVAMGLLAIVLVPLTVAAFNHVFDRSGMIEPVEIAKIIATSVLAPLLAGLVVRHIFPAAEKISGQIIAGAGVLLIIVVVIVLYGLWPTIASFLRNGTLLALAGLALAGLAVGHALGGPVPADRTALALATATRHPAVALAVATSGSVVRADQKSMLGIILLYLIVATVISIPYRRWRSRRGHGALG